MVTVPETVRGNRESIGPDSAAVGRGIREGENQDGRTDNAPGWSSGNSWISKDNQLALNFSQSDVVEDCGNSVKLSDQGIPYQVVDKENRTRRELEEEVGVVTSEQIGLVLEDQGGTNLRISAATAGCLWKHAEH